MKESVKTNMSSTLTVACLSLAGSFSAQAAPQDPPRGADVGALAGNCGIGPFAQTAKAGYYNELCDEMQDAEKCLALIKGHFRSTGETDNVPAQQKEKAAYCLNVLKESLGL